ncbi:G kinase-anchoring protein 1 [Synchiropus picturatus]
MASSAMITVPTTASRFALLQIDSDSDSDASDTAKTATKNGRDSSGKSRPGKAGSTGGKGAPGNDKKKDKKKKKKEQQQSEANELRNLAFKKIPQKSSAPPPCVTLSGIASELLNTSPGSMPSEGWQQWKQRDEQMTTELYEADLEKALMLSKLEFEKQKQTSSQSNTNTTSPKSRGGKEGGGKKEKKKNQQAKDKKTVSLQDFQSDGNAEQSNRRPEKEDSRSGVPGTGTGPDERFFNKLEDDVTRIIQREKRLEQYSNSQGQEATPEPELDPRSEQLRYELEKKDQEISQLKNTISQWEMKYKEVKLRNSQLLKMLQQGEMKDKAEILLQVEELLHIKEELSSQVSLLHAALEQERSKVKGLQSEQPKHQGNKKGKKASESEP